MNDLLEPPVEIEEIPQTERLMALPEATPAPKARSARRIVVRMFAYALILGLIVVVAFAALASVTLC